MPDERIDKETKKLPRLLVVAVIVVSAGLTVAAMSVTGMRGPAIAWDRASKNIESVWGGDPFGPTSDPRKPTAMAAQPTGAVVPVAALPGVPTIVAGAPLIHADRGVCTNCHGVVTQQGVPVPAIYALSSMTHEYRGVCSNCHQVKTSPSGIAPVAGTLAAPVAAAPAAPPAPIDMGAGAPPRAARQPTEAEWQGLEVGPAPAPQAGVLVAGAEGAARRTGMRTGDVITSINAVPVRSMADFVRVTENGALPQGAVVVQRDGQRLAFEVGVPARAALLPQPPLQPRFPAQPQLQPQAQLQPYPAQPQFSPQPQFPPQPFASQPQFQTQSQFQPQPAAPVAAQPIATAWGAPPAAKPPEAQF